MNTDREVPIRLLVSDWSRDSSNASDRPFLGFAHSLMSNVFIQINRIEKKERKDFISMRVVLNEWALVWARWSLARQGRDLPGLLRGEWCRSVTDE